jgi:hypothetical protein
MRVHEDTFKEGDIVTWRDEERATVTDGRKRFGDRLTIKDISHVFAHDLRYTNHTQMVSIWEDPEASYFSGASFRHLAPWERGT